MESSDRVRGGSSEASIAFYGRNTATFSGFLDTSTLGGAGFASVRTDAPLHWDLSAYDGITITIANAPDRRRYLIALKDALPGRLPSGRLKSTVSWEATFVAEGVGAIFLPWKHFKPTYRGKNAPESAPLDLKNVQRVSIMMRSFFDRQSGPFTLQMASITATKSFGGEENDDDWDDKSIELSRGKQIRRSWRRLLCGVI